MTTSTSAADAASPHCRWVVGEGDLFETMADRLSGALTAPTEAVPSLDIDTDDRVVVAAHGWDPDLDLQLQDAVRETGAWLLPARVVGDLGIVGPWVHRELTGCQVCAERRRRLWRRQSSIKEPLDASAAAQPVTLLHRERLVDVVQQSLEQDLLHAREVYVARGDLVGEVHEVVPLPGCPGCSQLPDDAPERARVELSSRIQEDPAAYRAEPDGLPGSVLRDQLCDWRYGPVGHVFRSENSAGALVSAELALTAGAHGEGGYGRALSFPRAETIALYEAAERLASATPHGKRTVVSGAQQDLADAIDLRTVGLHDPANYDDPLFRFTPYDPSVPTDWVWAWQLDADCPVLVPEHLAYWQIDPWRRRTPGPRFLFESSNGCALGSSLEEAILYGLLEVVERDAFLLAWYSKRPAVRLDVDEEVPEVTSMRPVLRELGYQLHLFDITTEIGVPAVLSLVAREDDEGPVAFFAAGAHCDPRRAVASAAHEAVTNAVIRVRSDPEERREFEDAARPLLDDPSRTQTLREHTVLYNLPETRSWWDFLRLDGPTATLAETYGDWESRWQRPDLTDTLRQVRDACTAVGLDPLVVDQSDRTVADAPTTVKVLVPGALPMTFGHVNRRTENLDRLRTAPVALGYRHPGVTPIDPASVPPHPFP